MKVVLKTGPFFRGFPPCRAETGVAAVSCSFAVSCRFKVCTGPTSFGFATAAPALLFFTASRALSLTRFARYPLGPDYPFCGLSSAVELFSRPGSFAFQPPSLVTFRPGPLLKFVSPLGFSLRHWGYLPFQAFRCRLGLSQIFAAVPVAESVDCKRGLLTKPLVPFPL